METNEVKFSSLKILEKWNVEILTDKKINTILEEKNPYEKCFEIILKFKKDPELFKQLNARCNMLYGIKIDKRVQEDSKLSISDNGVILGSKKTNFNYTKLYIILTLFSKILISDSTKKLMDLEEQIKKDQEYVDFLKSFIQDLKDE